MLIVVEDVAARLAVEAVGDDVARIEQLEDLVQHRRRLADMHHQRQPGDPRHLPRDLDRGDAPGAQDDVARAHLDAADHVAVGLDAGQRPLDVDRADVDQLADPVAGDEPDRADVQEREDALGRGLDDELAKAGEVGLAGRAGVDQRDHPALEPALARPDRDVGAAVPDMDVQVAPAGRHEGAVASDDARLRLRAAGLGPLARSCRRRRSGCRPDHRACRAPKPTGRTSVRSTWRLGARHRRRSSIMGAPPQRSLRSRGSSRSRSPSPIICSESTASTMATPGKIISQSAVPT